MDDGGDVWIFIDFCGVFHFAFLIHFGSWKVGHEKLCLWGGLGFECCCIEIFGEREEILASKPLKNYVNDDPFRDEQTTQLFCSKYITFCSLLNHLMSENSIPSLPKPSKRLLSEKSIPLLLPKPLNQILKASGLFIASKSTLSLLPLALTSSTNESSSAFSFYLISRVSISLLQTVLSPLF